jgi:hypothetical protein
MKPQTCNRMRPILSASNTAKTMPLGIDGFRTC